MVIFKKSTFLVFTSLFLLSTQLTYAGTLYEVKNSDTMDKITKKFYAGSKLSKHQIYIGILAENPAAFRLGNINHLKIGQSLNLPDSANLLAMEKRDATKLVAQHNFNAIKGKKAKMAPPFEGYSPRGQKAGSNIDVNALADKQQTASEQLEALDSESEALRIRLEQLIADKEAMDAELNQLDNLIKQ